MNGVIEIALILLLSIDGAASAAVSGLRGYRLRQLRASIEANDWYGAKRTLAFLEREEPTYYAERQFDLTRALIAIREEQWESALAFYPPTRRQDSWAVMEKAACLEKLGRYRQTIDILEGARLSSSFRWNAEEMRGRCYRALGDPKKAVAIFSNLTQRQVPVRQRVAAYGALMELYYELGDVVRARSIAESLQANHPESDAALYSVDLQEAHENQAYLNRKQTWERFAEVGYRNRDFERSDRYFGKVAASGGSSKNVARARYYLLRTYTKREQVSEALAAFRRDKDALNGTAFEGPTAFQYARVLLMNGLNEDVIEFVDHLWRTSKKDKWPQECMRLMTLALRSRGNYEAFRDLEVRLKKGNAPSWLLAFYHRNGLVWSMAEHRSKHAEYHLEEYRRTSLNQNERQEALVWEGLIRWASGDRHGGIDAWLRLVVKDPNHYFGLMAREFLREAVPRSDYWSLCRQEMARLDQLEPDRLKRLYYVAPDREAREAIADRLRGLFPQPGLLNEAPSPDTRSGQMAEIGRFGLAADFLERGDVGDFSYHFLKARWHLLDHNLYSSIHHGEILVNGFPRWLPYELLPEKVQQLAFPRGFGEIVTEKAAEFGVDPYLVLAIIREESRFDNLAKSWASARGLMQFIPSTARSVAREVDEIGPFSLPMLYEPRTSITLGARYIENLMKRFEGEPLFTVAAYNAGEHAVQRWRALCEQFDPVLFVGDVTYQETRFYCQKVLRAYHHYTRVYENGAPQVIGVPALPMETGL